MVSVPSDHHDVLWCVGWGLKTAGRELLWNGTLQIIEARLAAFTSVAQQLHARKHSYVEAAD